MFGESIKALFVVSQLALDFYFVEEFLTIESCDTSASQESFLKHSYRLSSFTLHGLWRDLCSLESRLKITYKD